MIERPQARAPDATLYILFVMRHAGFVRNYQSTIRELLNRGHRVHVAYQVYRRKHGETVLAERLAAEHEGFTYGAAPRREQDEWGTMVGLLRLYLDYLRYLKSRYRQATRLRQRVEDNVPAVLRWIGRVAAWLGDRGVGAVSTATQFLECRVPHSPEIRAFVESRPWSMLLVTPLVDVGSDQVDYVREASQQRIPSALCVASWDNLTNKGLMRVVPDRVFLWNEGQKREAVEHHGARPEQVVVTGAQLFDDWFDWTPSRTRETFAAQIGLRGDRPFILYLGSSFFIAPNEVEFAERWVAALRASDDPLVADADILIRPHPNNRVEWLGEEITRDSRVTIWPPVDADPFAPEFRDDFFDSMWHAGVAVAVNTSAEIEAAIVGKTICTVRAPEFEHSQRGTLHFGHLDGEDGVVIAARDMEEHVTHIRQALIDPQRYAGRTQRFVKRFVRPLGLDVPATPILASAIEELGSVMPQGQQTDELTGISARLLSPKEWKGLWAWLLRPVAALVTRVMRGVNYQESKAPFWLPAARPLYRVVIHLVVLVAKYNLLPRVWPWAARKKPKRRMDTWTQRSARQGLDWSVVQYRRASRICRRMSKSGSKRISRTVRQWRSVWFLASRICVRVVRVCRQFVNRARWRVSKIRSKWDTRDSEERGL